MEKKEGGETLDAKIRGGNTELNIGSQEFVCIYKMRSHGCSYFFRMTLLCSAQLT